MAGRLESVEIFRTGTWNGSRRVTVTEESLDEMVNSFNELSAKEKGFLPILKLGHADTQKYFGQKSGAPNLGFVEKIWKEGNKILANFANVPDAIVDLIRKGRYNSVSIEMFPKTDYEGKTFSNVLTAVALLGAELPAVKGLQDLAASLFTEEQEFDGEKIELKFGEVIMTTFTQEQVNELVAARESEIRSEFSEKVSELEATIATLTEERDSVAKDLAEFQDAAEVKEIETFLDASIESGKMLPKQRDAALAIAKAARSMKFSEGESAIDLIKNFVDQNGKQVDLEEKGSSESEKETFSDPADELAARIAAHRKEHENVGYGDAMKAVFAEHPDLKARYVAMEK